MVIINPVPLPPFGGHAYTNITPFTYRDGWTFQRVLEELRKYIRDVLVPLIDGSFEGVEEYVNNAVSELVSYVDTAINESETWTSEQVANLTTYVNEQVQLIINDSIQVQDSVVAGILENATSASRVKVDDIIVDSTKIVTAKSFGAVGDGIADDTASLQAMLDYLSANGGTGLMDGIYRITAPLSVIDPAAPAKVHGQGRSTVMADFELANVFNVQGANEWRFDAFSIDAVSGLINHGIAFANCTDSAAHRIAVSRFDLSAVMFYHHTGLSGLPPAYNTISECIANGGGVGRNGFFHESSIGSRIIDCHVNNLSKTLTPAYGFQIKNNSTHCVISGGTVDGAIAGVAFGYEIADSLMEWNIVKGVDVTNAIYGFLGSRMENNDIDISVDMVGLAENLQAIRLAGNANRNVVKARVKNPNAASTIVYIQDDHNIVNVPLVMSIGDAKLAEFAVSAANNTLTLGTVTDKNAKLAPNIPITNLGDSSNMVQYDSETPWEDLVLMNGWTVQLGRTPQVKRVGNIVHMRGQVSAGTDVQIASIPGQYRPKTGTTLVMPAIIDAKTLTLTTGGNLSASSAGGNISLAQSWAIN